MTRMGVNYPFTSTVVLERDAGPCTSVRRGTWHLNPDFLPPITMRNVSTRPIIPEFPL